MKYVGLSVTWKLKEEMGNQHKILVGNVKGGKIT